MTDTSGTNAMNAPFFPEDAPFSDDQRTWIAGFMAGMRAQAQLTGASA